MLKTGSIVENEAILISKQVLSYQDLAAGKGIPVPKEMYEVVFKVVDEEVIFYVSIFEYEVLELNEIGHIKYRKGKYANELLSFSDKIKEVV